MTAISVCLVGKESVLKEGVKSLLTRNDFNILADYGGLSLIPEKEEKAAQLIVGIEEENDLCKNIHKLKSIYTKSRIVIIGGNIETSIVMSAFDAGVDGLILKDI